jgi:hypothetical protein
MKMKVKKKPAVWKKIKGDLRTQNGEF